MTVSEKVEEIAGLFSTMSSGVSNPQLVANYSLMIAQAFSELAKELKGSSGWSAATGTASRAAFDTATVTLPQLASRVKAIIDDQLARGDFAP